MTKKWHKILHKIVREQERSALDTVVNMAYASPPTEESQFQAAMLRFVAATKTLSEDETREALEKAERLDPRELPIQGPVKGEVERWVADRPRMHFDGPSIGDIEGCLAAMATYGPIGHYKHVGWKNRFLDEVEAENEDDDEY